jgi:hypothetical protein
MAPEIIYAVCKCGKAVPTGLYVNATDILAVRENYKERVSKCPYCDELIVWGNASFVSEAYARESGKI